MLDIVNDPSLDVNGNYQNVTCELGDGGRAVHPGRPIARADAYGDGQIDELDVQMFVRFVLGM